MIKKRHYSEDEKQELLHRLEDHKKALRRIIKEGSDELLNKGKKVALIGAGFFFSYTLITALFPSGRRSKKKKGRSILSIFLVPFANMVAQQGAKEIVSLARKKLINYLERRQNEEESEDRPGSKSPGPSH